MIVRLTCTCGTTGTVETDGLFDAVDVRCTCGCVHVVTVIAGQVAIDGAPIDVVVA